MRKSTIHHKTAERESSRPREEKGAELTEREVELT